MAFSSKKSKASQARLRKMAEEVTFSERPDKTFNVRAFGAKGDGKTDDWRALQQAIAFAYNKTGGGTLFFPPGTYRVSEPLLTKPRDGTRGGVMIQLTCDFAKVNNVVGRFGV